MPLYPHNRLGSLNAWKPRGSPGSLLFLDFTQGSLPNGVDYTGNGGTGTRVNSAGLIVASVANQPRFDHNPNTLAPLGILIEPARTNLCIRATELDHASWTKTGATATANAGTGPDGAASADLISETATTALHFFQPTALAVTSGLAYATSFYAKKGTGRFIQMHFQTGGFGGTQYANIDLQLGTVTASAVATVAVSDEGDFWRISYLATATGTASVFFFIYMVQTGTAPRAADSYLGNIATNNLFYGFQVEQGAAVSSFIPTAGTSVTRTADALAFTIPGGVSSIRYTFDDDSTQDVAVSAGAYTVPTNLNRARIKTIRGIA